MTKHEEINREPPGVGHETCFFLMAREKDDPSNMDAIGMIMILVRFFTVKTEKIFSGDILLSSTNNKNSFLVFCGMATWEPVRL